MMSNATRTLPFSNLKSRVSPSRPRLWVRFFQNLLGYLLLLWPLRTAVVIKVVVVRDDDCVVVGGGAKRPAKQNLLFLAAKEQKWYPNERLVGGAPNTIEKREKKKTRIIVLITFFFENIGLLHKSIASPFSLSSNSSSRRRPQQPPCALPRVPHRPFSCLRLHFVRPILWTWRSR